MMLSFKKSTEIFFLLFAVSLIIKLVILVIFKFDGFYGQDSYAFYDYSKSFISSVNNFSIPQNFYFPLGFYIFTYITNIFTLGNTSLAAMCVVLLSNSLIPPVTFLLSFELVKHYYDERTTRIISLFSGIVMCFSGSVIQSGIVIMSDSLGLILALTSIYLFIKYNGSGKFIYLFLSFSFLSFSIITRYINALLIPYFLLILIVQYFSTEKNFNWKHLILSILISFVIFLPQLYYILNYGISYLRTEEGPGQWTTQWSLMNLFRNEFFIADGTFKYTFWNLIYYAAVVFHPMNFFLIGIFFLTGLFFIIYKKYRLLILYLFSWIFIYYIFLAGMPLQVSRYTLGYSPAIAIIASVGIFETGIIQKYRKIIFVSLVTILLISGLYRINNFVSQKKRDLQIVEYVKNKIDSNATLFSFFITGTINHYSPKKSLELYYFNKNSIKEIIDSSKNSVYFIVPESVIDNQWKGLTLEQTFNFMKSNYNPDKIYQMDNYTIYCIKKL